MEMINANVICKSREIDLSHWSKWLKYLTCEVVMDYEDSYLPVDPDFMELIDSLIQRKSNGKIHYFNAKGELDDAYGEFLRVSKSQSGEHLVLSKDQYVRLDKIITVLGKPGPAYEEYDRYANACLNCSDEGQFVNKA